MWEKMRKGIILISLAVIAALVVLFLLPGNKGPKTDNNTAEQNETEEKTAITQEDVAKQEAPAIRETSAQEKTGGEIQGSADEKDDTEKNDDVKEIVDGGKNGDVKETVDDEKNVERKETAGAGVNIPAVLSRDQKVEFSTVDLDGEEVTQDIFSAYDITVLLMWGTYCGSCIHAMPDVAEFYHNLPANINVIGIVCDVYEGYEDNVEAARDILAAAGADFQNLRLSRELYNALPSFQYIPSSFMVDQNGCIIGSPVDGTSIGIINRELNQFLK